MSEVEEPWLEIYFNALRDTGDKKSARKRANITKSFEEAYAKNNPGFDVTSQDCIEYFQAEMHELYLDRVRNGTKRETYAVDKEGELVLKGCVVERSDMLLNTFMQGNYREKYGKDKDDRNKQIIVNLLPLAQNIEDDTKPAALPSVKIIDYDDEES